MNYALTSFDYGPLPDSDITRHIGPPLEQTIGILTGSSDVNHIDAVTARYRERYAELGFREAEVYPGITAMLEQLAQSNIRLGVCTSKLHSYAGKVLETFDLAQYFEFMSGAVNKSMKSEQLGKLLSDGTIDAQAIMIGDRSVDLTAAHSNGLQSAGVLWGYGDLTELSGENPKHVFESPTELANTLSVSQF